MNTIWYALMYPFLLLGKLVVTLAMKLERKPRPEPDSIKSPWM